MAKKASKRRPRARATRQPSVAAAVQPAGPAATARPASGPGESAPISHPDLAEEYRYVYSDLKRVGILAGSMLGLLIVLALLAQYLF